MPLFESLIEETINEGINLIPIPFTKYDGLTKTETF